MFEARAIKEIYAASLQAKWHSFHFEVLRSDRGLWLQLVETRPKGHRQRIIVESDSADAYQRELLKAVSAVRDAMGDPGAPSVPPDLAHSAGAVRPRSYAGWGNEEDQVLIFLHETGAAVGDIALALQRERGAVRSRLRKLQSEGACE